MTGKMTHDTACRAEAARCRAKAGLEISRRTYWLAEAKKWEQRAEENSDDAVSYQIKDGRLVPKDD